MVPHLVESCFIHSSFTVYLAWPWYEKVRFIFLLYFVDYKKIGTLGFLFHCRCKPHLLQQSVEVPVLCWSSTSPYSVQKHNRQSVSELIQMCLWWDGFTILLHHSQTHSCRCTSRPPHWLEQQHRGHREVQYGNLESCNLRFSKLEML